MNSATVQPVRHGSDSTISLEYGLARRSRSLTAAFRLVHDRYVERGYMRPDPSGLRLSLHHGLPSTKVFVATDGGRVAGTVSLIEDSRIGVPMDGLYGEELGVLRRQRRRLSEVSALAIDDRYNTAGVTILKRLILLLIVYAIEIRKQDDICIAVNPRHVRFYQRLFPRAAQFGHLKSYDKVNGAPAVLLRLDLRAWPGIQERYGDLGGVYDALSRRGDLSEIVAALAQQAREAVLTPRQFAEFFEGHRALADAPAEAREFVESFYEAEAARPYSVWLLEHLDQLFSGPSLIPA